MADQLSIKQMVQAYLMSVVKATDSLIKQGLHGHYLVVAYSTIDTLGLLGAPPGQIEARKSSFLPWVERYLLPNLKVDCTAIDIWAARCAILHTFSTQSELSRKGKARELQYFIAEGDSAKDFISITREIDGGAHIPMHLYHFGAGLIKGIHQFAPGFITLCEANEPYANRLRNVLQVHPMLPPLTVQPSGRDTAAA